ncbi:MAG: hypothetical protein RIR12_1130 [Bacteroidota bacterium]
MHLILLNNKEAMWPLYYLEKTYFKIKVVNSYRQLKIQTIPFFFPFWFLRKSILLFALALKIPAVINQ